MPQSLLLTFVFGLVVADQVGQAGQAGLALVEGVGGRRFGVLAAAFGMLVALALVLRSHFGEATPAARSARGLCGFWVLALVLSFGAGYVRLAPLLAAAQHDADRVEVEVHPRIGGNPIRLIEAEVVRREARVWGLSLIHI